MIISSDGKNKREDVIKDFKKLTAKKCLELIEHENSESRRNCLPVRQGRILTQYKIVH